jgi:hypothetical protein
MKSPSLLLVDDDAAFRQVMAGELSRLGYEVEAVGTGEEAIRRVAVAEPEARCRIVRPRSGYELVCKTVHKSRIGSTAARDIPCPRKARTLAICPCGNCGLSCAFRVLAFSADESPVSAGFFP